MGSRPGVGLVVLAHTPSPRSDVVKAPEPRGDGRDVRAGGTGGTGVQAGSESTVTLDRADLVPTDSNLLEAYGSFEAVEAACEAD